MILSKFFYCSKLKLLRAWTEIVGKHIQTLSWNSSGISNTSCSLWHMEGVSKCHLPSGWPQSSATLPSPSKFYFLLPWSGWRHSVPFLSLCPFCSTCNMCIFLPFFKKKIEQIFIESMLGIRHCFSHLNPVQPLWCIKLHETSVDTVLPQQNVLEISIVLTLDHLVVV